MGLFDRFKKAMRDDVTAIAEDIADSVAAEWSQAKDVLESQGVLPLGPDLSGFILLSRARSRERLLKPLSEKEKLTSQRILENGLPATPLSISSTASCRIVSSWASSSASCSARRRNASQSSSWPDS